MDTNQWPQGIGLQVTQIESNSQKQQAALERKPRPQKEQALNCPRCNSTNTKFCYYNNYSLSQPRYFCKTCRRYWTEGGTLRNVPVGGGSRKNNKRSSSISSASSTLLNKKLPDLTPAGFSQNTPKIHESHDLNLTYPTTLSGLMQLPNFDENPNPSINSLISSTTTAFDFLKSNSGLSTMGFSSLMSSSIPFSDSNKIIYSSLQLPPMQEFKPKLMSFSLDGFDDHSGTTTTTSSYGSLHHGVQEVQENNSARPFLPCEDFKYENRGQEGDQSANGYWNGMLGGGGSW
ncbi:hypothetical protein ACH5RR_019828 [Cinchona calisaya]|uniref:Dof zinc finger protein n=1 Tax=Cinchona calisaya TaxID=153742 RepID=A0ABD2ZQK1_9GENT